MLMLEGFQFSVPKLKLLVMASMSFIPIFYHSFWVTVDLEGTVSELSKTLSILFLN